VDRALIKIAYFLIACFAVGMVTGACRATTLPGVLRKSVEAFVSMTGWIVAICVAIWLLTLVTQA
jgi:hypothetical protein